MLSSPKAHKADSAVARTTLGYADISGIRADSVVLRLDSDFSSDSGSNFDSVDVVVNLETVARVSLWKLRHGVVLRPFLSADTARVAILEGPKLPTTSRRARVLLESDARLIGAVFPARGQMRSTPNALSTTATTCDLIASQGACGSANWNIVPFKTGSLGVFQSNEGTGASGSITISFTSPVNVVSIRIYDPTYQGNTITATGPSGMQSREYNYSGIPYLLISDEKTLFGEFTSVTLTAAGRDYVGYSGYVIVNQKAFTVSCAPATVVRGQSVTCTAELRPAAAFIIKRQIAQTRTKPYGKSYKIDESISASVVPSGGTAKYEWPGIAAESTRVTLIGSTTDSAGTTIPLQDSSGFAVAPRPWPQVTVGSPQVFRNTMTPPARNARFKVYPTATIDSPLGLSGPFWQNPISATPTSAVPSGPNRGLTFFSDPPADTEFGIWMHPGLYNLPPSQDWYAKQQAAFGAVPATIGGTTTYYPRCGPTQFATFAAILERHEGVTQDASRSHWGLWQQTLRAVSFEKSLESIVARPNDGPFADFALKYISRRLEADVSAGSPQALQQLFDSDLPTGDYYQVKLDMVNQTGCFPFFF